VLAALGIYIFLSFERLGSFPPVGEDEPWIAAAPFKLVTQGTYGSDLFAGYYGLERHNFEHMPLYPLMQAAVFRLIGVGVVPMRVLPVACGFCLLLAIAVVGRQVGGDRVAAGAVALMIVLRIADGGDRSGILLLDQARVNRYDIAVPVFALLALWTFNRASNEKSARLYAATGVLTGLATLSHLFGVLELPVFVALTLAGRRSGRSTYRDASAIVFGFALTLVPWVAYVATGWRDFLGQTRYWGPRMNLLSPSFYVSNALHGAGPISLDWALTELRDLPLSRIGTWVAIIGVPVASVVMIREARRSGRTELRTLPITTISLVVLFAALLKLKSVNYMIGIWPFAVLLMSWFAVWLWDRRRRLARATVVVLLGLVAVEGTIRIVHMRSAARLTTSYDWFESQIARCIPDGSLVLGLQHYWLGLRQYPFRSWLVPMDLANPLYYHEPMTLDRAIDRVGPDVILIDRYIEALFENGRDPNRHPDHELYLGFTEYLARHRVEPACVIRDSTYGTMQVFRVSRPPAG